MSQEGHGTLQLPGNQPLALLHNLQSVRLLILQEKLVLSRGEQQAFQLEIDPGHLDLEYLVLEALLEQHHLDLNLEADHFLDHVGILLPQNLIHLDKRTYNCCSCCHHDCCQSLHQNCGW